VQKIDCSGVEVSYLVVNKPIKNIYLRVKDGYVQINCNKSVSKNYIERFICKNIDFITQKFEPKESYLFGKKVQSLTDEQLKEALPPVIVEMLKKHTKAMQLYPSKIGFRFNKSRWGSCSSANSINFNYYLAKLPYELIEYVVVHELAHIKHKNHSQEFWDLVEKFMPDMKKRRKKLREFEKRI